MRWRQFLTPVHSFDPAEAKEFMRAKTAGALTLLDVRQPEEYASAHLPGAKLVPLPELSGRLAELDPDRPTIVYCAVGGRSRIAAQILAGKGFAEVYNLSGGIKAWEGQTAAGGEELGLSLFSGTESAEETLIAAYGLEEGLRDFYQTVAPTVKDDRARRLFETLAAIEIKHQERILDEYATLVGTPVGREEFNRRRLAPAMEGGLTTEEYLARQRPDVENPLEVASLAMAIEAQAMDLYQRAADRAASPASREMLARIARDEQSHLEHLGALFKVLQ